MKIEIYHKLESSRQYNTNSRYSLRKMLIWIKLLIDQISFFVNYRCDFYYTKSVFLSKESNFTLREKFETILIEPVCFYFHQPLKWYLIFSKLYLKLQIIMFLSFVASNKKQFFQRKKARTMESEAHFSKEAVKV